jgi:hypothetical protein
MRAILFLCLAVLGAGAAQATAVPPKEAPRQPAEVPVPEIITYLRTHVPAACDIPLAGKTCYVGTTPVSTRSEVGSERVPGKTIVITDLVQVRAIFSDGDAASAEMTVFRTAVDADGTKTMILVYLRDDDADGNPDLITLSTANETNILPQACFATTGHGLCATVLPTTDVGQLTQLYIGTMNLMYKKVITAK